MKNLSLDYVQISLGILARLKKPLIFDVFVKRTEKEYTKLFMKGDPLDLARVKQYKEKGINYFYVTKSDYQTYTLFVERMGDHLSGNLNKYKANEALNILKEMVNFTLYDVMTNVRVDERTVKNATNVVDTCLNQLEREPKMLLKLVSVMSNHAYIFKHSITVSIFSVMLAKASGIGNENTLQMIGLGAFLHDVGTCQLSFDPEDRDQLTPEERKEVWRHPQLGKQMLDGLRTIRTEVLQMVLQHHEQPNGHGYPNGLREGEIYPPAKILAICDCFASMITKRTYRDAFTPSEAIEKMFEDKGKFDTQLLKIFKVLFFGNAKAA